MREATEDQSLVRPMICSLLSVIPLALSRIRIMQRTRLAITTFFSAEERATIFACAARVLSLAIPPALNPTDNVKYAMSTVPRSLARQVQFGRYPIASTSVPFFRRPPKGQDLA